MDAEYEALLKYERERFDVGYRNPVTVHSIHREDGMGGRRRSHRRSMDDESGRLVWDGPAWQPQD